MITYEEVRCLFKYDPITGHLLKKDKPVGTPHSLGYLKIKIKGKTYFVHRIIFLYCSGRWPNRIDHLNRNKSDNRLENLRECTNSNNGSNRGLMANNSSGFKGVHWQRSTGYWRAQVGYKVIGHFKTKEEAALAYDAAALEHYGEFALTNKQLGLL